MVLGAFCSVVLGSWVTRQDGGFLCSLNYLPGLVSREHQLFPRAAGEQSGFSSSKLQNAPSVSSRPAEVGPGGVCLCGLGVLVSPQHVHALLGNELQ